MPITDTYKQEEAVQSKKKKKKELKVGKKKSLTKSKGGRGREGRWLRGAAQSRPVGDQGGGGL